MARRNEKPFQSKGVFLISFINTVCPRWHLWCLEFESHYCNFAFSHTTQTHTLIHVDLLLVHTICFLAAGIYILGFVSADSCPFLRSHAGIIGEASVGDAHQEMWHGGCQVCDA